MITINLGAEGEYGRRLARYLEMHMKEDVRLRHYTRPGQWAHEDADADLSIMSRFFYNELASEIRDRMSDCSILWITEEEEEEGYCRFHAPEELRKMILHKTCLRKPGEGRSDTGREIIALFTPVFNPGSGRVIESYAHPQDLYLGMADFGGETGMEEGTNDMGDLCYYIHLRDPEIISRVKELSVHSEKGYDILPSPAVFLPLLELTGEDYRWFFEELKKKGPYHHIYVGLGCGMLKVGPLWSCFNRMILISSREDRQVHRGCEHILRSAQAGYEKFSGSCAMVYREDMEWGDI